jgi:hypothetical protein
MTLLLELLALELGGFMFGAAQQGGAQNRLEHLRGLMPSATEHDHNGGGNYR